MTEQSSHNQDIKQTVLIADDEEALATAIAATLDLEGLQAVVTHNGEQALVLARALHPDLILLDIMMPGRSGIEVCATLKTDPTTASIPVIFITARAEDADRMVGIAAGAGVTLTLMRRIISVSWAGIGLFLMLMTPRTKKIGDKEIE